MAQATSVSDLERAEHLNYADGKGVKRVSMYNNGVQVNAATADNQTNGNQKTQIVNASGTTISSITHGDMTHLAVDHEDISLTDTISGLNDSSVLDTHGVGSVIVLVTGTWQGKIDIQGTIDSTWVTLSIVQPAGQLIRTGINNDAQNGSYRVPLTAGYSSIRAIFTSWSSGTASIVWNASQAVGANFVFQLNQANLLTTAYQATASNLNVNATSNGANLATAANQSTANSSLSSIDTKIDALTTPTDIQQVAYKDQFGWSADCTPNAELVQTEKFRLVGSIFNGSTVDTNFWTTAVSTGTVTQASSELILTSGTANGHTASVYSVRRANWVTGTSNKYRAQMRFGDTGTTNVTRTWGVGWGATMPTVTDGAYFKLSGTAFSVNTIANGSEAPVASANFNGTYAAPTFTNNNTYEILYTLGKVYFLLNNVIIHTATFSTTHWTSNTTNFHVFANVVNTGDSAAVTQTFRMMNISRLGTFLTMPTYKYITGAGTTVCKLGGGLLHNIIINQAGTLCTIYDQTSGAVPIIGILDTAKATGITGSVNYECPFFNGLTVVTTGAGTNITVVYE